jgi:hypothetical protein
MQHSPVARLFLSVAQLRASLRHDCVEVLLMMNRSCFDDPSPGPRERPDEPKPAEPLVTKPKVTFQWPPDCLWPFIDQEVESDT